MWVFEWTNEQFQPAIKEASLVYRKMHAYAFVSEFLANKQVLEVASTDVSGSGILARQADSVVTLVADNTLAQHATNRYGKAGLQFLPLRPEDLVATHEHHFDAVVCLEGMDGSAFPPEFLPAIKRLLKRDGIFAVSSVEAEGLVRLLSPHFRSIEVFGQGVYAGSSVWPLAASLGPTTAMLMSRDKKDELQVVRGNPGAPSSLIAIAGDGAPLAGDMASVLLDGANELLEDQHKVTRDLIEDGASRARTLELCEQQLAERRESLASLQEGFAWQERQIASLHESRSFLESEIAHYRNALSSNEEALRWRASQVEELESRAVKLHEMAEAHRRHRQLAIEELRTAVADLKAATDELRAIKTSAGWGVIVRIRSARDRLLPPGSSAYRLYQRFMSSSRFRGGK